MELMLSVQWRNVGMVSVGIATVGMASGHRFCLVGRARRLAAVQTSAQNGYPGTRINARYPGVSHNPNACSGICFNFDCPAGKHLLTGRKLCVDTENQIQAITRLQLAVQGLRVTCLADYAHIVEPVAFTIRTEHPISQSQVNRIRE